MKKSWLSFSFINFLIISLVKFFVLVYVCVYIWSFYIWDTRTGTFTLIKCLFFYLEILLSFIIFIQKHYYHLHYYFYYYCYYSLVYCNYLPIFTKVTTYILTLYWFQNWFSFRQCFFLNSMLWFFVDFSSLVLCHFFPRGFLVVTINWETTGREFKSMNSSGIAYTYLSIPISKPFLISMFLFCFISIKS